MREWVLLYWHSDRSGVQHVWGPFPTESEAIAVGDFLTRIGLYGVGEPCQLESLPLPLAQVDRTVPEIVIERTAPTRYAFPISSETVAFLVGVGLHAETVEVEHQDGRRERLLQVGLALAPGGPARAATHYRVIMSVESAAGLIAAIHANAKASGSLIALSAAVDQCEL